jgi:hypothetical protein
MNTGKVHIFSDGCWRQVRAAYSWRNGWVQVRSLQVMADTGWVRIAFADGTETLDTVENWDDLLALAA